MLYPLLIFILLFAIELFYIKVAGQFNIIDPPNQRSSHTHITLRGGGIIFPLSCLLFFVLSGFRYPFFTIGLMLIAAVSFIDDLHPLSSRIRMLVQLLSFTFCFYQLSLFQQLPFWSIPILYIVGIGIINAVNFMDGINGMTALYMLSVFISMPFIFIQYHFIQSAHPFLYVLLAAVAFGFFNIRRRAVCFAGDVGSISAGYIFVFLLMALIFQQLDTQTGFVQIETNITGFHIKYILLLTVYGVDSVFTIIHRLYLREPIFQPHRRHLYQYLANEKGMSHLSVAAIYASVQLVINLWVMNYDISLLEATILIGLLSMVYVLIKRHLLLKK